MSFLLKLEKRRYLVFKTFIWVMAAPIFWKILDKILFIKCKLKKLRKLLLGVPRHRGFYDRARFLKHLRVLPLGCFKSLIEKGLADFKGFQCCQLMSLKLQILFPALVALRPLELLGQRKLGNLL